jgi:hypothetical protein
MGVNFPGFNGIVLSVVADVPIDSEAPLVLYYINDFCVRDPMIFTNGPKLAASGKIERYFRIRPLKTLVWKNQFSHAVLSRGPLKSSCICLLGWD